ncbi:MAG: Zn-dependent hydrolase, partial [Pseudoxanthomonas sp.]
HYRVDFARMKPAVDALSAEILTLQGDGDHAGARAFLDQYGKIGPALQSDLDRIAKQNIPVDIVFKQGREVLGL